MNKWMNEVGMCMKKKANAQELIALHLAKWMLLLSSFKLYFFFHVNHDSYCNLLFVNS